MFSSRLVGGAALVATAAALAVAAPANAADTTRPVLAGTVVYAPATVDTTTGDATSTVSVQLRDDSAVTDAVLTLSAPDGSYTTDIELDLATGTKASGTWTGPQPFSAVDATGTWRPVSLSATDAAGNNAVITTGLGNGITMTRTADTVAPTLVGASATTTAIDTTSEPGVVLVRVQAKDDLAGVAGGRVTFDSDDGTESVDGYLSGAPVQGSALDGSWDVPVTFPVRTTPGVWRLSGISVADAQYNEQGFGLDDERVPSLSVRVRSDDDATGPSLSSYSVGPAKRSSAYGTSGVVYAQVGFSDAVSGVASVQVTLQRPNGVLDDADAQPVEFADADIRTGTARSGTVGVPVYVENFTAGTWKTASVTLTDNAGNITTVATAQLPAGRTTFDVSTAASDTQPPTSSGAAFSPTTVDTRADAATGTLLVAAKDPDTVASGVAGGTATLTSPSGLESVVASFTGDDVAAGDQADGTFRASYTLPRDSEDGTWTVTSLTVADVAKRSTTQTSWTSAPALTVLGKGRAPATVPGAPGIGNATVKNTSATVAFTAPADNGGAAIRGYRVTALQAGVAVASSPAATSPATVPNLRRGQSYTFTVAAENGVGVGPASAPSNAVAVAAIAPGAPTIGRATVVDTTATVTWTPPADDGGAAVTDYRVTPVLGGVAQPPQSAGTATSLAIAGLARGRTYTFRVAAVNGVGTGSASQDSNSVSVAATVPAAPRITSTSTTGNTVTVRWSAPTDDGGAAVTGYRVTGSPAGSCTATSSTSCTVSGLTPQQSYTFTVAAQNRAGSSVESTQSQPAVAGEAMRPTTVAVTSVASSIRYGVSITVAGRLSWSGSPLAGQPVRLQYRRAYTNDAWTTWPQAATSATDGGVRFTGFRPSQSVVVRLVAEPAAPYTGSTSASRTVMVTRQVTIGTRHGAAKRGSKITISGRANPTRAGDVVVLQRWSKGSWRKVASARTTSSGYHFRVRLAKRGTYSFRVVASADTRYAASASPARALRVR